LFGFGKSEEWAYFSPKTAAVPKRYGQAEKKEKK
jgi:hypothetical protein